MQSLVTSSVNLCYQDGCIVTSGGYFMLTRLLVQYIVYKVQAHLSAAINDFFYRTVTCLLIVCCSA